MCPAPLRTSSAVRFGWTVRSWLIDNFSRRFEPDAKDSARIQPGYDWPGHRANHGDQANLKDPLVVGVSSLQRSAQLLLQVQRTLSRTLRVGGEKETADVDSR